MDNILVASACPGTHLEILSKVFYVLKLYNLEINFKKCYLSQPSVNYLGYLADEKGIRPNESHCLTIKNYPRPKNIRELHFIFSSFCTLAFTYC